MREIPWPLDSYRGAARARVVFGFLAGLAAAGCGQQAKIEFTDVAKPPSVEVIMPPIRNIVRVVGQPSFIESYERTSVYPKPSAYIQKWIVDIGDKVKKNDVLATLFAPELVEELVTKKAMAKGGTVRSCVSVLPYPRPSTMVGVK